MLAGVSVIMCAMSAWEEPTTPGFEGILRCRPASFPITELFCYTVMMIWFLSYSFHSRPGSCHIQGQGQDFGPRFSKSANA